jgi:predicted negative regulator of RcsB-dependent stress response
MMAAHLATMHLAALTSSATAGIILGLGIPLAICGAAAIIVWSYFNLQAHRADAVAMANYRKLAEEAVANQQELRTELTKLTEHVRAVEQLMRDVG